MKLLRQLLAEMDDSLSMQIEFYLDDAKEFSKPVQIALKKLTDEQWQALINDPKLREIAESNYDYATDTGASIYIPEKDVFEALMKVRNLSVVSTKPPKMDWEAHTSGGD